MHGACLRLGRFDQHQKCGKIQERDQGLCFDLVVSVHVFMLAWVVEFEIVSCTVKIHPSVLRISLQYCSFQVCYQMVDNLLDISSSETFSDVTLCADVLTSQENGLLQVGDSLELLDEERSIVSTGSWFCLFFATV